LFPFRSPRKQAEPVMVMHGSLDHHHLRQIAVEGISTVMRQRPDVLLRIIGQRTGALETFLNQLRQQIPRARIECTGFIPYHEVAPALASATIGIVPYEESIGTHCAFVAKIVEYLAVGLFVVSTPLQSARRYFQTEKMVRFSKFDGADFGRNILSWLEEDPEQFQELARAAGERVGSELDWRPLSRKAIAFMEHSVERRHPVP
jgi:glycosyltransferase involved in cell wall biosynthesis